MAKLDYLRHIESWDTGVGRRDRVGGSAGADETTRTFNSRRARRFNMSASTAAYALHGSGYAATGLWSTANENKSHGVGFHMWIDALPGASQAFYLYRVSDATLWRRSVSIDQNGKIEVRGEGSPGSVAATSTGAMTTGKWYYTWIEWLGPSGQLRVTVREALSGVSVIDVSGGLSEAPPSRFIEIGPVFTSTGNVVFDNLFLISDATASNVGDPVAAGELESDYAIGLLAADGTGAYDTGWNGTWADNDEIPHDGDTTYRQETTGTGVFTNTLQASSSLAAQVGTVKAVVGILIWRDLGGMTGSVNLRMRSGSTDSNNTGLGGLGTTYAANHRLLLTDPATGSAWTVSAIDSLQIGAARSGNANQVRVTATYVEVLYNVQPVSRQRKVAFQWDAMGPGEVLALDRGEAIPPEEVVPNVGWARILVGDEPQNVPTLNAYDDPTLSPIESVYFRQTPAGSSIDIRPTPDDLVDLLIKNIANTVGQL